MSSPHAGPVPADQTKRLEHVLAEIEIRESHERGRQASADSKLAGALAVVPIVVGLASTAFFEMLPRGASLGRPGIAAVFVFVLAIIAFVVAACLAANGLWPNNNGYSVVTLRDILRFGEEGTYEGQLRFMISERAAALKLDAKVNERKLGRYMSAQLWILAGLGILTLLALFWAGALVVKPSVFAPSEHAQQSSPHAQVEAKPGFLGSLPTSL